ncbi:MAG TPA: hypothetical protein VFV94_13250 [Polyangiaceae bacterium]|nr:hypothetical protein [Polyangiaceae bacterium]
MPSDAGWVGSWSPGIGDPTFVGFLTVVVYFFVAWRCRAAARRITPGMAKLETARRERLFWQMLTILYVVLGVNKQLDLQTLLTEIGRLLAHGEGWYEKRGEVQLAFILVVAALGAVAAAVALLAVRKASLGARVAAAGTAIVTAFVVIRAASFHHVDRFIHSQWLGLKANWILELGGLCIVLGGTWSHERAFRRAR